MRPLRLQLKPGVDPRGAANALAELVNAGRNVVASVPGGQIGPGAIPLAEAYVRWVETVQNQLTALSLDLDLVDALHTSRYWRIRQLHEEPIRPVALVQAEIDRQAGGSRRCDVSFSNAFTEQMLRRVILRSSTRTCCSSSCPPPAQIDWRSILTISSVRLVIPLRVIEELDLLKFDRRRPERADRARRILPQLAAVVGAGGEPREVREDTTIEVLVSPAPRARPADGDEEVLQTCQELEQLGGRPVTLISADIAIRLRAQALGIRAIAMPIQYSRSTEHAGTAST